MSASTNKRRPLAHAGLVLTGRDEAILQSVWDLRTVTRAQLQRLHFGGEAGTPAARAVSTCIRRLGLLRVHGLLLARRLPTGRSAGATPLVYSLGPRAVPLLAERLDVDRSLIERRQRQDARLAWLFFEHRQAITDVRIAFTAACRARGYTLNWRSDEDLAAARQTVTVDGRRLAVRPDAYVVVELDGTGRRTAFFLEVQRTSRPATFRRKAAAALAYWQSGAYTAYFGARSLRVLTVVESAAQIEYLRTSVAELGGGPLFWFAPRGAVIAEPFGPCWVVSGMEGRQRLLDEAAGSRAVAAMGAA
jgi:hypothetical protein